MADLDVKLSNALFDLAKDYFFNVINKELTGWTADAVTKSRYFYTEDKTELDVAVTTSENKRLLYTIAVKDKGFGNQITSCKKKDNNKLFIAYKYEVV